VNNVGAAVACLAWSVVSAPAWATDNTGWFEVTRGMIVTPVAQTRRAASPTDYQVTATPGDTLASIALRETGMVEHAFSIARYNGLAVDESLPGNTVVLIPQALLPVPRKQGQIESRESRWQIQEFEEQPGPPTQGPGEKLNDTSDTENTSNTADSAKNADTGDVAPAATSDTTGTKAVFVPSINPAVIRGEPVATENIDMFAGEVNVMGRVEVTRVAVGNGDIVRVEVLKSGELLVIAQSSGSTSLRLWHTDNSQSDFNIRVSDKDPETRVRMETMVRMRVRMIEFRKSALGKLGIDWSDSAEGPGFSIAGDAVGNNLFRPATEGFAANLPNTVKPFQTYFGIASNITSRINFLASTGDATTLAEPVLSTTNGGSASFLAGGEVPYPSIGANGQTIVQFKEYGIKLNVSPNIDASGNVRTVVETEISQLDPAVSVQGAPGLLTRKAQTQVNVRSGETIVISGLLSSESSKDIDKLPGIGNLPVIGNFFRARNARNSVSELVIFVTPEIVSTGSELLSERQQAVYQSSQVRFDSAQQKIQLLD